MQRHAAAIDTLPRTAAARRPAFARVEVFRDASAVEAIWADLEQSTPCSIYQTRAWLLPWADTLGRRKGIAPLFVIAWSAEARPVALLCLGIIRRGPLRIATWLGGSDANFNMPLLRPDVAWSGAEIHRLLRDAVRACGRDKPDLFSLPNQPFEWQRRDNPFALMPHQTAPSAAYGTALPADAETLFAVKLSKETRKKLRKKEAKLATLGPLSHLIVADADAQCLVLDRFIALKVERFRSQKISSDFDHPEMRAFIKTASAPQGAGIELHALLCGDRIVAIYGGAAHTGQWSGMFNAFDSDDEIAKSSPGDLLLMRVMAKACADGLGRFDLGIGEARYKAALCDERISLFDAMVPVTVTGRIAARALMAKQTAKRIVKANPRLLAMARRVRAIARK